MFGLDTKSLLVGAVLGYVIMNFVVPMFARGRE